MRLYQTIHASALCTGVFLCLSLSPSAQATSEAELNGVKQEISRQTSQVRDKKNQLISLEKTLKQQELTIASVAKKIHQADRSLSSINRSITQLQTQEAELLQRQLGQRELLKDLINAHYRQGQQNQLALLLSEPPRHTVDRLLIYSESLSQARVSALDELAATQTELQLKQHTLQQQQQQQQRLHDELQQHKQQLDSSQRQRRDTVQAITGKLSSDKRYLSELHSNQTRLKQEIAKAAAAAAARSAPMKGLSKQKGRLPWPVKGKILHSYASPLQGELQWKGVVIGKSAGSKVHAIHPGKVVFADWLRGYGLMLVIDHGQGDMSLYGYNQTLLKKVGDVVQTDEPIALVGDSGGQKQPALYFEIRRKGSPSNPKHWLSR